MATKTKETYYAWTQIRYRVDGVAKTFPPGKEVTAEMLGLDDEGWEELIRTRAIRTDPFPPIPKGSYLSPVDYFRKMAKQIEDQVDDFANGKLVASLPPNIEDEDDSDSSES